MNNTNSNIQEESLREQVKPYLKAWPWLFLSALICLGSAYVFLRYATKQYQSTASIIIKDTPYGGGLSETGVLGDIGIGNNFNSVENEIEILKSKRLLNNVIDHYNLTVNYSRKGNVKESDIYDQGFINLIPVYNDSLEEPMQTLHFFVKSKNDSVFEFRLNEEEKWVQRKYNELLTVNNNFFPFLPTLNEGVISKSSNSEDAILKVTVRPKEIVLQNYHSKLTVETAGRRGSVVNLTITDEVGDRAVDLLNRLIVEYNMDAINDKNIVALNTAKFIQERLSDISKDLDTAEINIQSFKNKNNVTDINLETSIDLTKINQLETALLNVETQLAIASSLKDFMSNDLRNSVTTSGLGLKDVQVNSQIEEYNKQLIRFQKLSKTSTSDNPVIKDLTVELAALKKGINNTLNNYLTNLKFEKSSIQLKLGNINSSISRVPINEKTNRTVQRNREIYEAIYLLLRQKQETTAISLAVTAPKAKIVDSAYFSKTPVSPKPKLIYLAALILAIAIPLGLVYLKQLFYNKIESRKDLEKKLPQLSILGEIPRLDSDDNGMIESNDRSVLAESFRIIRTNLQYKISTISHNKTPVVLVSSTVKGEGKTMIAFNLANTFAYSGKKVLLIGGDIRNPQLHRFFKSHSKKTKGVTEFLTNGSLQLKDLVVTVGDNNNLSMILSGAIPPNPAELWMQDRTQNLFEEAKEQYDLVIVDSAPTIVVTDTFLINKYADVTVYVSRANYTDTALLDFVADTVEEGKLNNVAMVINSVKLTNFGYGNKYGYTYAADKKQTLFGKFKEKMGL
ncbi:MAG: GumC family protein [Nonlabens sp.]|uniref:GumC family protein n=1 Tax=Nonlabens sp. TaxID=1888209 RepID=UPI003EF9F39E